MSDQARVLKSGVWYTLGNFLLKGIGFITTPIFTRLLTQAEFGEFSNFISWISIMTIVTTLIMGVTLLSAKYDYKERFDQYIFSVLALGVVSVAGWTLLVNVFIEYAEDFFGMNRVYINSMMLYIFGYMAVDLFQAREQYLFEYKKSVITSLSVSVGSSVLAIVLMSILPDKLVGRILGHIIPVVCIGTGLYIFFGRKGKRIDPTCWPYALKISLPYIPHSLSMTLLHSTDRVMIKQFCGPTETALYSVVCSCAAIITMLISSLNSAVAPWMGEVLHKKEYEKIRNLMNRCLGIVAYTTVGIMLVTPEIILILGGQKYAPAVYVMPPLAMGCYCQFVYNIFVNVEQFNKKTVGMAIGSASAALLNYVLNMLLIPRFGYIAAGYTTLISYSWLMLVHMFLVRRMKMQMVANYKLILLVSVGLLVVTCSMGFLYDHTVVRYGITVLYILITAAILLKNKKSILEIVCSVVSKR